MKKLEEMLKNRSIKNKLSLVFRIMDVLYIVIAFVAFGAMLQTKNYVGIVIVLVLAVISILFTVSISRMLTKALVEPIESLVVASEKIASGDFEIGTPYESEDELGRLSDSFETAAGILKKVVSDLYDIVEHFSEGNFDVHSSCPDAYVGQLHSVLDELNEMGVKLMVSVWPTVETSSENYAEMEENGFLIQTEAGRKDGILSNAGIMDATNPECRKYIRALNEARVSRGGAMRRFVRFARRG